MLAGVLKVMVKKLQIIAAILCISFIVFSSQSYALESSVQLHKVDQDKSSGYSVSIGDEFFNQKAFIWQISYNQLVNVAIVDLDETSEEWAKADLDFSIQTVDLSLGYRYYPKSYDKFFQSLMFEALVGVSANLSDNKFVFKEVERNDLYFSNQGDINAVFSLTIQKSFTKNSAMHIGFKHYPSFSDFGSISTVFVGFNYRFGRQTGY